MIDLSAALSSALGRPVTNPGLLIRVEFSVPRLWSSRGNVIWGGGTWQAKGIGDLSLEVDAFSVSGSLVIDNRDGEIGSLVLSEGVYGRPVRIWGFDAEATNNPDVLWLCDAAGWEAEFGLDNLTIPLRDPGDFITSPRARVMPEWGFNSLMPSGAVIRINGYEYKLERPDE